MKIRLALFAATLLLLPPLALFLSDQEWSQADVIGGNVVLPALLSVIAMLAYTFLLDTLSFRRSRSSLLRSQLDYTLWLSAGGALLCALLVYLNTFSMLWVSPLSPAAEMLLAALFGAAALPAVLITRLWLSGFPALLRILTRNFSLPAAQAESIASLLLLATLIGLLGGTVWASSLAWLLWISPLLLLVALQLLWHESTVFSGVKNGDWSRIVLGFAAGMLVGGSTLLVYRLAGGALYLSASAWFITLQLGIFGLLCLQLGDVIAENWRGKKRSEVFKKKPFPISVVVKK